MMTALIWPLLALAQAPAAAAEPVAAMPAVVPAEPVLLVIAIDRDLSWKTAQVDEFFPIRLKFPLVVNGREALPAGIMGEGQVVHVNRAKGLGKGGEMIVAARYLQCGSQRLALRGFRLGEAGGDKTGTLIAAQLAVGVIAAPLMFMKGGESIIPAGTIGQAKLATALPIEEATACAAPPPSPAAVPAVSVSQQGVSQ